MKNNKGFTLVELISSFVMIMILSLSIFKTVIIIQNKQVENVAHNSYIVFQSTINNVIQTDFSNNFIRAIELCGTNCYKIKYEDDTIKELSIDTQKNIITYGSLKERLPNNFSFYKNITIDTKEHDVPNGYNSFVIIRIPVESTILTGNTDLSYIYQFNNKENPILSSI